MSLVRYFGYKDSGVEWLGEVPEAWEVKPLRRFTCLVQTGPFGSQLHADEYIAGGIPVINPVHLIDGMIIPNEDMTVGPNVVDRLGHQRLRVGDVIFSRRGELGRCALVTEAEAGWLCGTGSMILRLRGNDYSAEYLSHFLSLDLLRQYFESFSIGAIMNSLSSETLLAMPMVVPSINEQHSIETFLKTEKVKIDLLVEEQRRLIELLKEKRQAVISHAVAKGLDPDVPMKSSGVDWIREVPVHWEVIPIKHLCSLLKDGTHLPPPRVDSGIPLLSVRNLVDGSFVLRDDDSMISIESYAELCQAYIPRTGDVLLAIVGATLGKTAIVPNGLGSFHIQRSVAIFRTRPGILMNRFLSFVFQSSNFQSLLWEYAGYSAQPGIYLGTLKNFAVPLPSVEEQVAVVDFLDRRIAELDDLVTEAALAVDLLQERRTALISAAVTGKIDVRGLVAEESIA
jgi:type I restriction enzyme, S subunit